MPELVSPTVEFYYDSANHSYHILEKQENPVDLYEEQYDCQGEELVFPTKNVGLLISNLKEDHGASFNEEQDAIYLYSKKGEILELKGLYRAFNIIWNKTSPLLHQPFVNEMK